MELTIWNKPSTSLNLSKLSKLSVKSATIWFKSKLACRLKLLLVTLTISNSEVNLLWRSSRKLLKMSSKLSRNKRSKDQCCRLLRPKNWNLWQRKSNLKKSSTTRMARSKKNSLSRQLSWLSVSTKPEPKRLLKRWSLKEDKLLKMVTVTSTRSFSEIADLTKLSLYSSARCICLVLFSKFPSLYLNVP